MEKRVTGCIYAITCKPNGMIYIGSTKVPETRFKQHFKMMDTLNHHSKAMNYLVAEHGVEAFSFEVVEDGIPEACLLEREQEWINRHSPVLINDSKYAAPTAQQINEIVQENRRKYGGRSAPKHADMRPKVAVSHIPCAAQHHDKTINRFRLVWETLSGNIDWVSAMSGISKARLYLLAANASGAVPETKAGHEHYPTYPEQFILEQLAVLVVSSNYLKDVKDIHR